MFEPLNQSFFSLPLWAVLLLLAAFFALVAIAAVKKKALTVSGAAAAFILGMTVTLCLKFEGLFLLFFFFLSSTLIGKLRVRIQAARQIARNHGAASHERQLFEKKGDTRDWIQVAANGLFAMTAALLSLTPLKLPALVMYGAALSEAASDTWAGEIGRLSEKPPVSMKTGQPVPRGVSGGVTALGFASGFAASLVTAAVWILLVPFERPFAALLLITLSGFAGCIADSLLGAFVQALYKDPSTGHFSEVPRSKDGNELELLQGIRWIDNDMVNILSNLIAAVFAFIAGLMI